MSLEEYLDNYSAQPGATAAAAKYLLATAGPTAPVARVCEIGPGSGRYAQHVVTALRPEAYEIYETARDWHAHLNATIPNVVNQPADGHTLSSTTTASVDLVHAHKVFVYLPLATSLGYMEEMARVVRPGGVVAFDILTENCLDDATLKSWIEQNTTIYRMMPRQWTIDQLSHHDLTLIGSTFVPLSGAHTELLVFRRQ
jgi:phospholipid N-methyltransferase